VPAPALSSRDLREKSGGVGAFCADAGTFRAAGSADRADRGAKRSAGTALSAAPAARTAGVAAFPLAITPEGRLEAAFRVERGREVPVDCRSWGGWDAI
jgi:hypothetical protein